MITIESIRINIAEAIKQSNLTQAELSSKIGVQRPQISCYIHGSKLPALDTLANLCNVLDVEPNEILCFSGRAYNAEYEKTSEPMAERLTKEECALLQAFKGLTKEKKAALFAMLDIKPL